MRRFANSTCPIRTHRFSRILFVLATSHLHCKTPLVAYSAARVQQGFAPLGDVVALGAVGFLHRIVAPRRSGKAPLRAVECDLANSRLFAYSVLST